MRDQEGKLGPALGAMGTPMGVLIDAQDRIASDLVVDTAATPRERLGSNDGGISMEPTRFDALARRLAHGTSRRQMLKGLAVGLLGVAAAPLATSAAPGGNSTCAQFCAATFGADTPAAKQCAADAAKGMGLCYSCGPASPGGTQALCCTTNTAGICTSYSGTTCPSLTTDVNNCGGCGTVCTTSVANATATCVSGVCGYACTTGYSTCSGLCVNEQTDVANCGGCGNVCTTTVANATATCTGGICGFTCHSGYIAGNGYCAPTSECAHGYNYDGTCL